MRFALALAAFAIGAAARGGDTPASSKPAPVKPGYKVMNLGPEPMPKNAPAPKQKPSAEFEQSCQTPSGQTINQSETGFDGCLAQKVRKTKIKATTSDSP